MVKRSIRIFRIISGINQENPFNQVNQGSDDNVQRKIPLLTYNPCRWWFLFKTAPKIS
jgi:hypothetical protein